jgi:predicted dehydrogenase
MDDDLIRLGVIGCGGFGLFALQQFIQVPGVTLVGMAGTHRPAARAAAARFGVANVEEVGELCGRDDVDAVYIATPPFLHFPQAMAALQAGKHVIVEKPLALTVAQADALVAVARQRDRLLVANLMQRYNRLWGAVHRLVETRVLGDVLHGSFENYASDENLPADHWFWDRGKSGGIFVEHGVHFFDLFAGWLGPGRVEAAQVGVRPGTTIEEHVHATVRYGAVALVNFYHGFHQAGRMDRQELRLVFERGDVTLFDWVPTRARIHALLDERQTRALCDLFPGARLDVAASYGGTDRACRGRGAAIDAYQLIDLSFGDGQAKSPLYCQLLRSLMADQMAWVRDRSHRRVVTEVNGRDSLATACAADALAPRAEAER